MNVNVNIIYNFNTYAYPTFLHDFTYDMYLYAIYVLCCCGLHERPVGMIGASFVRIYAR